MWAWAPGGLLERVRRWIPEPVRLGLEQFIRRWSTGGEGDRPALAPAVERALRQRYDPHVQRLASMIGRDLSAWQSSEARASSAADVSTP